jgi:protein involved in polysaccharide export with SLBB domain
VRIVQRSPRTIRILAIAGVLAFSACASSSTARGPVPAGAAVGQMQPLAPGDAVRITAWREEMISGEYQIDETGHVVLPMLGSVRAADLEPTAVKQEILEGYANQVRNSELEVTLLRRVAILGDVTTPGLYLIDPTMVLADAVALAGGASSQGNLGKTRVLRTGVDVTESMSLEAPLANQLRSGDQIFVPKTGWFQRNGLIVIGTLITSATILWAALLNK